MLRILAALLTILPALAAFAATGDRVALVIGNSSYQFQSPLANPTNDTAKMAETLTEIGYDVTVHTDLGENDMERALAAFADKADNAEIALVYYSGHGMEIGGANYLIPIDAELRRERDAQFEAVELRKVRASIAGASKLKVVILDACRNNTFLASTRSSGATRGLARVVAEAGEVVAYSTAPGSVAQDGPPGGLSPYTRALSEKLLEEPDLDVRFLFTSIGRATETYAGVQQRPYTEFAAILPDGQLPLGQPAGRKLDAEFQAALEARDLARLAVLLQEAPENPFAGQARQMIEAEARRTLDAEIDTALAAATRGALQAALSKAGDHPRRPALAAALALHDTLDRALAEKNPAEIERFLAEAGSAHPRRASARGALRTALFADACVRLARQGLSCPEAARALAQGKEPTPPAPTPVAAAPAPAPAPPVEEPKEQVVAALNPAPPAPEPAPPADPLIGYLTDISDASLARAEGLNVAWLQTALKALGHLKGAADGVFGPGSQRAVAAWRADTGVDRGPNAPLTAEERVAIMKMAASRSIKARAYLGVMYGLGVGVSVSPDKSRALLSAAEADGFADAGAFLNNIAKTWK